MTLAPECSFAWDGAALAIFLGAVPVAVAVVIITLYLYRRAIGKAMLAAGSETAEVEEPVFSSPPAQPLLINDISQTDIPADSTALFSRSVVGIRRLSFAILLAGLTHATIATMVMFRLNDLEFSPARFLLVWVVFIWPLVAVVAMTETYSRWRRFLLIGSYFGLLLVLEFIAELFHLRYHSAPGQLFILWAITMGPPSLIILLLVNRAWRPMGLITLFISIVLVGASLIGFQMLGCLVLTTGSHYLQYAFPLLLVGIVGGCLGIAWIFLRIVAAGYQSKRASDMTFMLDSWWLLVTTLQALFQLTVSGAYCLFFFTAFIGYKLVLHLSLKYLRSKSATTTPKSMLLLRVFGHKARVRTLTDRIGQAWRHIGPINMIGGTDLASALLEPDELMSFWNGRLRRNFVASADDLNGRLASLDDQPDPDGRYRIHEFFCHDNTWRQTVQSLAERSAVVLMDLRGFGRENKGCEFELAMLLAEVELQRVLLLVDHTTHIDDLTNVLTSAWKNVPDSTPNHLLEQPELNYFHLESKNDEVVPLLKHIFAIASFVD